MKLAFHATRPRIGPFLRMNQQDVFLPRTAIAANHGRRQSMTIICADRRIPAYGGYPTTAPRGHGNEGRPERKRRNYIFFFSFQT